MMNKSYSLNDIPDIAKEIISSASGNVLLFHGAMGAGKTTLIKEIVKQLEVDDVVNSPTFSLVNEYHSRKGDIIYHFDFYRIDHEEEAYDMGVDEYLHSGNLCLIEWPEKVENLLPLESVVINLFINDDDTRTIQMQ